MKKAKIMLSAIAILAVVGGAFAFKASRQLPTVYTYTTNAAHPAGFCTTAPFVTVPNGNPGVISTVYTSSLCTSTVLKTIYTTIEE